MRAVLKTIAAAVPAIVRDAIGLTGFGLVAYGAWLAWHPAGFLVGGAVAVLTAWLLGLRNDS